MKKKDLLSGDIIMQRDGELGIVLVEDDCILFQRYGKDELSFFNDDLTYLDNCEENEEDIIRVYRDCSFYDIQCNHVEPIFKRDLNDNQVFDIDIIAHTLEVDEKRKKDINYANQKRTYSSNESIKVMAQHLYGNRSINHIHPLTIKPLLIGIYDYRKFSNQEVDLKIVKVPNSNNVVIIYDQIQEDIYLNPNLTLKQKQDLIWFNSYRVRSDKELITCEIKEIDFKIHTNCIACKMDENGQFKSLEDCDILLLLNYFVA